VRGAILANANTLICFRLGEEDAGLVGRRFEPGVSRTQLTDLDNFVAAVRTSVAGERVPPFTMRVKRPTTAWSESTAEAVRALSRRPRIETSRLPENMVPIGHKDDDRPKSPQRYAAWPDVEEERAER
jgi:hypothetical protein